MIRNLMIRTSKIYYLKSSFTRNQRLLRIYRTFDTFHTFYADVYSVYFARNVLRNISVWRIDIDINMLQLSSYQKSRYQNNLRKYRQRKRNVKHSSNTTLFYFISFDNRGLLIFSISSSHVTLSAIYVFSFSYYSTVNI